MLRSTSVPAPCSTQTATRSPVTNNFLYKTRENKRPSQVTVKSSVVATKPKTLPACGSIGVSTGTASEPAPTAEPSARQQPTGFFLLSNQMPTTMLLRSPDATLHSQYTPAG